MKKNFNRSSSNLVHRRLSEILIYESKDPRFKKVTISRVVVNKNLSSAKVHVSIFPPKDYNELLESLNKAAGFFSKQLGKVLKKINTPKLTFVYDSGFDHSDKIEMLLHDLIKKK